MHVLTQINSSVAHDIRMATMRTYGGARPEPAPQALGRRGSASDPHGDLVSFLFGKFNLPNKEGTAAAAPLQRRLSECLQREQGNTPTLRAHSAPRA